MDNYIYGGASNIGYKREINEDYVNFTELDNTTLFSITADGMGSKCSTTQPASIAGSEIVSVVQRVFDTDKKLFYEHTGLFLSEALHTANRVLGAFKMSNEELYAGFGTSISCCVYDEGGAFTIAHCGDTRIYLIRVNQKDNIPSIRQLTQDHTKARRLLDDGVLTPEHYHTHPDRLVLTSGLGVVSDPVIQISSGTLRENDILLSTTDGIHYAIIPDAILQLVVRSEDCNSAAKALIDAAKMQKYSDNMSAAVVWNRNTPK